MKQFKKQITEFIKARFPYVYIETHEEERVTKRTHRSYYKSCM